MRSIKFIVLICFAISDSIFTANADEFVVYGNEPNKPIAPYAVIIADNQYTADHGSSIFEQSFRINKLTPSARRSTLNNMFSLAVMEDIVAKEKKNGAKLVLHIGDGLNNGCTAEWESFYRSMQKSGLPWFLAPGNHDAFYLGISNPFANKQLVNKPLDSAHGWGHLCQPFRETNGYRERFDLNSEPRFIFTKRELIKAYLVGLRTRVPMDPKKKSLDPNTMIEKGKGITCHTDPNIKFLHRVCWHRNDSETDWGRREPWRDFIVQEIRWIYPASGKIVATLLVDSSDYPHRQKITSSCAKRFFNGKRCNRFGGIKASLSKKQRQIVNEWLAENKANGIKTVIAAHHPIRKFKNGAQNWQVDGDLKKWSRDVGRQSLSSALITAHTHDGYVTRRAQNLLAEFNVGSLVDAPVQYMRMNWGRGAVQGELFPRFSSIYLSKPKQGDTGYYDKKHYKNCKKLVLEELDFQQHQLKTPIRSSIKINRVGDREGLESQLTSFLAEAEIYSKLLHERGGTHKETPVCYRIDKWGCEGETLGNSCASTVDVKRCSAKHLKAGRFENMRALNNSEDALELANSIVRELRTLQSSRPSENKAIRLRRMIARKLEAIRIFEEKNPLVEAERYQSIKSCLSLLASHAR